MPHEADGDIETGVGQFHKIKMSVSTEEEKNGALNISIDFSEKNQIDAGQRVLFNAGYLFLQKIYYELGLPAICQDISRRYRFQYDLDEILRNLLYTRFLSPSSKRSSLEYMQSFLKQPRCDLHIRSIAPWTCCTRNPIPYRRHSMKTVGRFIREIPAFFTTTVRISSLKLKKNGAAVNTAAPKNTDRIRSFRRNWEGDYHCTREEVKAMLRDQAEDTSDMKILTDFKISDLNIETVHSYRNHHNAFRSGHVWENLTDEEYLERIGAARISNDDGILHPTAAGLLMFGEEYKII